MTRALNLRLALLLGLLLCLSDAAIAQTRPAPRSRRFKFPQNRKRSTAGNIPGPFNRKKPVPGLYIETMKHDGVERRCYVFLPPQYNHSRKLPLLVLLHGGGGKARSVAGKTRMMRKAYAKGYILVCPEGTGMIQTWNAGHCCGRSQRSKVDDVGYLKKLIAELERALKVHPKQVFAAGHSNGAMMAYRLAAEYSEKIAAIGVVAGAIGGKPAWLSDEVVIPQPKHPVSIVIFHGKKDTHVLYKGGHGPDTTGMRSDLSVARAVEFWKKANSIKARPKVENLQGGAIIKEAYTGGKKSSAITVYTLVNGGHGWPGSSKALAEDSMGGAFSATDEMLKFFDAHPQHGWKRPF